MWRAYAEYADGTVIDKTFPFTANSYKQECEDQYSIECWLLEQHENCTFYSVGYCDA